jgi:hypothetical protein
VVRGERRSAERLLQPIDGVSEVTSDDSGGDLSRLRVRFASTLALDDRAQATERCVAALVHAGVGVREVRVAGGSLEDVFAALTFEDPSARESRS